MTKHFILNKTVKPELLKNSYDTDFKHSNTTDATLEDFFSKYAFHHPLVHDYIIFNGILPIFDYLAFSVLANSRMQW